MAKEDMICPFSGKLCRECALYRGRHYYLCFSRKYRGYIEKSGSVSKVSVPISAGVNSRSRFEMPPIKTTSTIDPFTFPLRDI